MNFLGKHSSTHKPPAEAGCLWFMNQFSKTRLSYVKNIVVFTFLFYTTTSYAQLSLHKDTVSYILSHSPAFSIFKDNYFITGTNLGEKPTKYNSDAKFQFSFKYRLSDNPLVWGSFVYLSYTQKSFWDIYQKSSPFSETNYNPAIGLVKPVFKNDQLIGGLYFSVEHESNGRDSIHSRSWYFVSLTYSYFISPKLNTSFKLCLPFGLDKDNNPGLIDYVGISEIQLSWIIIENRLFFDVTGHIVPKRNANGSLMANLVFKPVKRDNLHLMLQWWQGYAESLINYRENTSAVRIGILFKPKLLRFY